MNPDLGVHEARETAAMVLRRRIGIVVACGLIANVLAQPLRALGDVRDTDFTAFLVAGRMVASGTHCLYCLADQKAAATAIIGVALPSTWNNYFVNPPPVALVMRALAVLSPTAALGSFAAGGLVCMVITAVVAWRRGLGAASGGAGALLAVASVLSLPAAFGLALGQWDPYLVLPAMLATLLLLTGKRELLVGVLLSLLLVKPQVALLVLPALCLLRAWRVLTGFGIGVTAWVIASLVCFGGQVLQWPAALSSVSGADAALSVSVPGTLALMTGSWTVTVVASLLLGGLAVAAVVVFRERLRSDPAAAVSLAIAASLLVAPHLFADDFIMLAPVFVVWARRAPLHSLGGALALSAAFAIDAVKGLPGFHLQTAVVVCIVAAASVEVLSREHETCPAVESRPRVAPVVSL